MTAPSPGPSRRGFLGATSLLLAAGATGLATPTAAHAAQRGPGEREFAFAHPGLLHSAADVARMRAAVTARQSPVYEGYLELAAHARSASTYPIQNTGQITSWGRGPANYQSQAVADSAAAYQNALMWCVTGDRAHADTARDILDAWSASLTAVTGADGQLGAGLQAFKLLNAAELLRHTGYDGWPAPDIARCEESFLTVWYPALSGYMLYANGNWDLTALQTILALGVFCENRTLFENALRYAAAGAGDGSVPHRIVTGAGQGQESGRDQGHEQLAVGLLTDAAQVAWNQGVDLYGHLDHALLANVEYAARYNLGGDVPFVPDLDRTGKYLKTSVSPLARGTFPPIYEMAYAHYAGVRGLAAPYTRQVLFRDVTRAVEGGNDDLPSWGTLTYAGAQPSPGTPAPPAGLFATGDPKAVTVSWLPSAWASTYTIRRSTDREGPYRHLESELTSPTFTDRSVRPGHTYYYTVSAANSSAQSASSTAVGATAGLPGGWESRDVGEVRRAGSTLCDGERFVLEAGGSDIGGTADAFRFLWLPLHGDGVVTARLVWPVSSQYTKAGVMLRDSLAPDAAHASLLIQGLPLHTWSGVWTTRPVPGGPTTGTGSTPVPPSQRQAITTGAAFPLSDLGTLPASATPLRAPHVEAAGDGYRLRRPYWTRVTRTGRRCTGAISPDGVHWTDVGSSEVEWGRTVYAGVAFTSCLGVDASYAETGTAAFDNVSVVTPATTVFGVPRPARTATDLRATAVADAVELTWTDPDLAARYTVLRATAADGHDETLATSIGPAAFGARIRYTDATGTPGHVYRYAVTKTNSAGSGPRSASVSARMPTPAAPPELASPSTAFANLGVGFQHLIRGSHEPVRFDAVGLPKGLSVDRRTGWISGIPSHTGEFTVTTRASNAAGTGTGTLSLTVTTPPPAPWTYGDLGDVVLDERQLATYGVVAVRTPGITAYDGGTFTVRGAGTDLNVNGQGMTGQFVRREITGDCVLTARLVSRTGATAGDRVGLLMAKSLSPFDQAAGVIVTAGTTAQLLLRRTVAGASVLTGDTRVQLPCLLRLKRAGTAFTAAVSTDDGATWTSLATGEIPGFGDAPFHGGLVVCSRDPLAHCTSQLDEVSIIPT
ncbi:alginate lyase family protein [Streptomyces sp. NPDC091279]|uniref:alginate lyase family protein n=1 Tax=Streptomyces sp. NPDC091279 TaxID=3365983 RepID=UPI00380A5B5B